MAPPLFPGRRLRSPWRLPNRRTASRSPSDAALAAAHLPASPTGALAVVFFAEPPKPPLFVRPPPPCRALRASMGLHFPAALLRAAGRLLTSPPLPGRLLRLRPVTSSARSLRLSGPLLPRRRRRRHRRRLTHLQHRLSSADHKEHIEICYGVLCREYEHPKDAMFEFLLQCAEQLPRKIPFFGVLIGLINLENEDFAKGIVDTTQANLQDALHNENRDRIRVLLRFLSGLMCSKVALPNCIIETYETLLSAAVTILDEETGNPS